MDLAAMKENWQQKVKIREAAWLARLRAHAAN